MSTYTTSYKTTLWCSLKGIYCNYATYDHFCSQTACKWSEHLDAEKDEKKTNENINIAHIPLVHFDKYAGLSTTSVDKVNNKELEKYKKEMDNELKTLKRNMRLKSNTNLIAGVNCK